MKKFLFLFLLLALPVLLKANPNVTVPNTTDASFVYIDGYYDQSWGNAGNTPLQSYNVLPANLRGVIGVYLDELPSGMYYQWDVEPDLGSNIDYQLNTNGKHCYVGFNGVGDVSVVINILVLKTDASSFSESVVTSRTFRFYVPGN